MSLPVSVCYDLCYQVRLPVLSVITCVTKYLSDCYYLCDQVRELETSLLLEEKKNEEVVKGARRYERKVKELTYEVILQLVTLLLYLTPLV